MLAICLFAGPACASETARTTPSPAVVPTSAAATRLAPTPTRTRRPRRRRHLRAPRSSRPSPV